MVENRENTGYKYQKKFWLCATTFDQVGNMNSELEETVNVAIEFFPGRVKRDEWAKQARKLAKKR